MGGSFDRSEPKPVSFDVLSLISKAFVLGGRVSQSFTHIRKRFMRSGFAVGNRAFAPHATLGAHGRQPTLSHVHPSTSVICTLAVEAFNQLDVLVCYARLFVEAAAEG